LLQLLNNPTIIKYIENFKENGYLNIIMEYATEGSLYDKI